MFSVFVDGKSVRKRQICSLTERLFIVEERMKMRILAIFGNAATLYSQYNFSTKPYFYSALYKQKRW